MSDEKHIDTKEELKEWFGLTMPDQMCYISYALVIIPFFTKNLLAIIPCFAIAVVLNVVTTVWGFKPKANVSKFTNVMRFLSYPVSLLMVIAAIIVKFIYFM